MQAPCCVHGVKENHMKKLHAQLKSIILCRSKKYLIYKYIDEPSFGLMARKLRRY